MPVLIFPNANVVTISGALLTYLKFTFESSTLFLFNIDFDIISIIEFSSIIATSLLIKVELNPVIVGSDVTK